MAVTLSGDLLSLESLGQTVHSVLFESTPLLKIPGIVTDIRNKLHGSAGMSGDQVVLPFWNTSLDGLVQPAVRDSRTGVQASKVSLDSYTETAATKVVSVDADMFAVDDAADSFLSHLATLAAKQFAAEFQSALLVKALETDLSYDATASGSGGMTVDAILGARCAWGDCSDQVGQPIALISTAQFHDLARTDAYRSLAQTSIVTERDNPSFGPVARVHGVDLYLLDNLSLADGVRTALLCGAEALGLWVSSELPFKKISHPGSAIVTYDSYCRFAATLWRHQPRRVVKLLTNESEG